MRTFFLAFATLFIAVINADRSLLASSTDPYGIVAGVEGGNSTAAVTGFVKAGKAQDTNAVVTALVQIVSNGMLLTPNHHCYIGRQATHWQCCCFGICRSGMLLACFGIPCACKQPSHRTMVPSSCPLCPAPASPFAKSTEKDAQDSEHAGTNSNAVLDQTAEAASEAVLSVPSIYSVILAAHTETILGQMSINSTASIQIASNALAALRSAQQPSMVQVCAILTRFSYANSAIRACHNGLQCFCLMPVLIVIATLV